MAFNGDGPHSKRQRLEESGHRVSSLHVRSGRRALVSGQTLGVRPVFVVWFFSLRETLLVRGGTANACVSACRARDLQPVRRLWQRRGESRHLSGRFYPYHRHRVETMGDARALEGDCLVSRCRVAYNTKRTLASDTWLVFRQQPVISYVCPSFHRRFGIVDDAVATVVRWEGPFHRRYWRRLCARMHVQNKPPSVNRGR